MQGERKIRRRGIPPPVYGRRHVIDSKHFGDLKKERRNPELANHPLRDIAEKLWKGVRIGRKWRKEKLGVNEVEGLVSLMLKICPNETRESALEFLRKLIYRASGIGGEAEFKTDAEEKKVTFYILTSTVIYKAVLQDGVLGKDPEWAPFSFREFGGMRFGAAQAQDAQSTNGSLPAGMFLKWQGGSPARPYELKELLEKFLSLFDNENAAIKLMEKIVSVAKEHYVRLRYAFATDVETDVVTYIELYAGPNGSIRATRNKITATGLFGDIFYENPRKKR